MRQKAKTCFKINVGQRLEKIAKSQPRKFWKSLKKCYNNPKSNTNDIKMEDLHEHFNTLLGQEPDNINGRNNDDEGQTEHNELDFNITEQEIRKPLFKQKKKTEKKWSWWYFRWSLKSFLWYCIPESGKTF